MFWFCFAWILWCVMHSLFIEPRVAWYIKERIGVNPSYYRLLYNLISVITLIPLLGVSFYDRGPIVFSWSGWAVCIRLLLFAVALFCFLGGARGYDLRYFLGFQQIRDGREPLLLGEDQYFSETGVFAIVRHPWYLGSLMFIWSIYGTYFQKNFVVAVILSVYLVVGTLLEERKIIAEYGDRYRDYQKRVSMLVPIKWLKRNWKSEIR